MSKFFRAALSLVVTSFFVTACGGGNPGPPITSSPSNLSLQSSVPQVLAAQAAFPIKFTPFKSPLLGTVPEDLTVGPDHNMWISTGINPGTIVRMTPKGVATAFTYPVGSNGSDSLSITPGPDGALWFVDSRADLVGKVTTKGTITTYPLPSNIQSGCQLDATVPLGITAGPDGAMWFTVSEGDSGSLSCPSGQNTEIGRITTTGGMTFFTMPESINGYIGTISPERITSGPDGLLWFTTAIDDQGVTDLGVGSITTAGVITVSNGFSGTIPQSSGDYLTFSSNQLYVADTQDDTIIHVSGYAPAATYPVPLNGGYGPYGITPDSNGRLWFTTHASSGYEELGSMTPTGHFVMHQIPPSFGSGCCGSLAFRETHQLWLPYIEGSLGVNVIEATNVP